MFEPIQREPPLATARDLAAYYARRERFYAAAAMLLAAAPDRAILATSRRTVDRGGSRDGDLARTLKAAPEQVAAEHAHLFDGDAPIVDLRCAAPESPSRTAAAVLAALPALGDIPNELRTLAVLSDRTAMAIEAGDIADAASLCDMQARFLRQHAGDCIGALATRLVASNLPFYGALGRALVAQIDEDMRLLAQ
jgi:hypothetical protein